MTEFDTAASVPVSAGRAAVAGLLPREFFDRPSDQVAPSLLGCVLEHESPDGIVAVALTEVEAYAGQVDPASHAYRGRTERNAVMFGPPGHAYVYFTYGMHFCMNVVCLPAGTASAVLLRAGRVVEGEELAMRRRAGRPRGSLEAGAAGEAATRDLARGPARLCQALAIDKALYGADLCAEASPLRMRAPLGGPSGRERGTGIAAPASGSPLPAGTGPGEKTLVCAGPRVGIREGADVPWRFWLDGDPTVSAYRPYARRQLRPPAARPDGSPGAPP